MFPEFCKNQSNKKRQLLLFSAKGKWKQETSICLLQTEAENKFFFLGQQIINGNHQ
jgi:hypothetical protein